MYTRTEINIMREKIATAYCQVIDEYESAGAVNAMIPVTEVFFKVGWRRYGLFAAALKEQENEGIFHRVWAKSIVTGKPIKSYLV